MFLLVAIASIIGVDLAVRYVGRKRRIPPIHEIRDDISSWNHYLELLAVSRVPLLARLSQNLANAGLYRVRLWQLVGTIAAFTIFGWGLGGYLFVGVLPSLGCAVVLGLIPIVAVLRAKAQRQERIYDQLDHVCSTIITRCLTGSQVADALNALVTEIPNSRGAKTYAPTIPPPLGPEMVRIYRDIYFNGMGIADACEASAERVAHPTYTTFMTEVRVAAQGQSPGQSLTDFRVSLEAERHLERFVTEQFSPWIAQAAVVPAVGTLVLLVSRLTIPNGKEVLSHPLGQLIFVVAWILAAANILFMRSQASLKAVLIGAEF